MKRQFDRYEPDNWTPEGKKILSSESIERIRATLANGPIIVRHWFYRGACSPKLVCFDDFDEFSEYLNDNAVPGDAFDVWSFVDSCKLEDIVAEGKLHDSDGCVPEGGAY